MPFQPSRDQVPATGWKAPRGIPVAWSPAALKDQHNTGIVQFDKLIEQFYTFELFSISGSMLALVASICAFGTMNRLLFKTISCRHDMFSFCILLTGVK